MKCVEIINIIELELAIDNRGEDVELYYLFKSLLKRTKKLKTH